MSEETPGQAVALAEIRQLEKAHPPGTSAYTQEIDGRRQALYQRAYPEPDEEGQAPAGRQFPEVLKPRREVLRPKSADPAVTAELRQLHAKSGKGWLSPQDQRRATALGREIGHAENERRLNQDRIDTVDAKLYGGPTLEGTHPSFRDWAIWRAAIKTAQRLGIEPEDMVELKEAVLTAAEEFPQDQDDGDDLVAADYLHPPPAPMDRDTDWAVYKGAAEIAARHGVSKAAFRELAGFVLGANDALLEPKMRRLQDAAVDVLVAGWGDRAGTVVTNAQRAISHFGDGLGLKQLFNAPGPGGVALGDDPKLIELFARIGREIPHDALRHEFKSAGVYSPPNHRGTNVNQNDVLAKIKELEAKAPLGRRTPEEDREITELYEAMYNDDEPDVSRSAMGSRWQ